MSGEIGFLSSAVDALEMALEEQLRAMCDRRALALRVLARWNNVYLVGRGG
jgi:hypothetical protein